MKQTCLKLFLFLVFFTSGLTALRGPLWKAFQHNILLNSAILFVLGCGLVFSICRLYVLSGEFKWFDAFQKGEEKFPSIKKPDLLQPVEHLSLHRPTGFGILVVQSVLMSVENRLESTREGTRYIIGLLIFMGLLGTFWGLSQTIGSVANIITDLDVGASNVKDAFQNLKLGLHAPLMGMGTAFSSSMFGLLASLVVGFFDLHITKLGGHLHRSVEELLFQRTKIYMDDSDSRQSSHSGTAYVQSLLEQTTENMSQILEIIKQSESNRLTLLQSIQTVTERLSALTEQMVAQSHLLKKVVAGQMEFQQGLDQLCSHLGELPHKLVDESFRNHLRNLDTLSHRLLEEMIEGRKATVQDLRNEIRLVARTISSLAEQAAA